MRQNRKEKAKKNCEKRRASAFRQQRISVLIVCFVLCLLTGALGVGSIKLCIRNIGYKQQEEELNSQIKEQEDRAGEIKAYQEYVKTDEYVKDVAEEKLHLVDPNEIIFRPAQ